MVVGKYVIDVKSYLGWEIKVVFEVGMIRIF